MESAPRPSKGSLRDPRLTAAVVLVVVMVLLSVGFVWFSPPPVPVSVRAAASQVLMNVSSIPEIGWGVWGAGRNGTGAWRLFAVHNELILATLNVTLWVEANSTGAERAAEAIAGAVPYATHEGSVPGADASLVWIYSFGQYGGMVVCRYNVVFLLGAHLETSFALTPSDFGKWAGWQLARIETFAR